jgi:hypothetical protein
MSFGRRLQVSADTQRGKNLHQRAIGGWPYGSFLIPARKLDSIASADEWSRRLM